MITEFIQSARDRKSMEDYLKGYDDAALGVDDDFNATPAWRAGWRAWSRDANGPNG